MPEAFGKTPALPVLIRHAVNHGPVGIDRYLPQTDTGPDTPFLFLVFLILFLAAAVLGLLVSLTGGWPGVNGEVISQSYLFNIFYKMGPFI